MNIYLFTVLINIITFYLEYYSKKNKKNIPLFSIPSELFQFYIGFIVLKESKKQLFKMIAITCMSLHFWRFVLNFKKYIT